MYQFTGQGQDLLAQARQLHTESNDFRAKRRMQKAVDSLEQAYKLRKTALISPHAVLTATVDCLAHLYQEMGNHERWHFYAKAGVEEKVSMLGELHVETQSGLDNLHDACIAIGDFEGANEARRRNWHARTSTLGIKDETGKFTGGATEALIGDIERMLEHINVLNQKIRKSTETEQDLETRLRISQGSVNSSNAVNAAQQATLALMHCDFNDRKPFRRDPELAELLADRMTPADYLTQFGQPPEARWRKGSQIHMNATGNPSTPPNELAREVKIPRTNSNSDIPNTNVNNNNNNNNNNNRENDYPTSPMEQDLAAPVEGEEEQGGGDETVEVEADEEGGAVAPA